MKKQTLFTVIAMIFGLTILTSCEKENDNAMATGGFKQPDLDITIAEYATLDKNFSTLVEALQKADLVEVFMNKGNYTVFAPTNEAFSNLFRQLGVRGVEDLSADQLTPILLYHVMGQKVPSTTLSEGYFHTLNQSRNHPVDIKVSLKNGVIINKDVKVTTADINLSNGIIHVIDKVMLPPTIVDHALANPDFSILVQAVVKAGLVDALNEEGPFTVFAPTNAAFEALFAKIGVSGISDLTAEQLTPILLYHVVSGNVRSTDLNEGKVETLKGELKVSLSPVPAINDYSDIIATDVQATNGVIHVIDEVLLPPTK